MHYLHGRQRLDANQLEGLVRQGHTGAQVGVLVVGGEGRHYGVHDDRVIACCCVRSGALEAQRQQCQDTCHSGCPSAGHAGQVPRAGVSKCTQGSNRSLPCRSTGSPREGVSYVYDQLHCVACWPRRLEE